MRDGGRKATDCAGQVAQALGVVLRASRTPRSD